MAKLLGVWMNGEIVALENGKMNFKRKFKFYNESEDSRKNKRFNIENGDVVEFASSITNGENVADAVEPKGYSHIEKKNSK